MKTQQLRSTVAFLIFLLVLSLVAGVFSFLAFRRESSAPYEETAASPLFGYTVILDAGHGGEDGGTSSASGLVEKDLNLAIAMRLQSMLEANGIRVIMTRTEDRLLYDKTVDYHGRKKALDLAARKKIAEDNPNAIFVSIHMNAYPLPQYKGLQVWYSKNDPVSQSIADGIQKTVQSLLQPENDRQTKAASSSIYLLHYIQTPAVLVECGFLSNEEEAALLANEEYQDRLALCLFLALAECICAPNG